MTSSNQTSNSRFEFIRTHKLLAGMFKPVLKACSRNLKCNAMKNRKILVTGATGFIGMHTAKRLLEQGTQVVGLDNLNGNYDPALKQYRLEGLWA